MNGALYLWAFGTGVPYRMKPPVPIPGRIFKNGEQVTVVIAVESLTVFTRPCRLVAVEPDVVFEISEL